MWLILCAILVFFMQAGFAMVEAGSVGSKNAINILFKNVCDACISAIAFWLVGFGIAYGRASNGFIGTQYVNSHMPLLFFCPTYPLLCSFL
jgi:Amt family ammonium transporter